MKRGVKRFLTPRSCLLTLFTMILLTGMGVSGLAVMGGPYWTWVLGGTILAGLLVLVSLSILIAIAVRPSFVIELRSKDSKLGKVSVTEIVFWCVVAVGMMLFGARCFLSTLSALLASR